MADDLALPRNGFTCPNGTRSGAIEALCIFLRRHSYPCRVFRPVYEIWLINYAFLDFVHTRWNHLLRSTNQPWLSALHLETYAGRVHRKGAALWITVGADQDPIKILCTMVTKGYML